MRSDRNSLFAGVEGEKLFAGLLHPEYLQSVLLKSWKDDADLPFTKVVYCMTSGYVLAVIGTIPGVITRPLQ